MDFSSLPIPAPIDDDEDQAPSQVPMTQRFGVERPLNREDEKNLPPGEMRRLQTEGLEKGAGIFKPVAQFMNVLASPDLAAGYVVGIPNALTELGNAFGDFAQRKPIDTSDNYLRIPDEAVRQYNPLRRGSMYGNDQTVLPSDEAAMGLGGAIPAEVVAWYTGTGFARWAGRLPMLANWGRRLQQGNLANKLRTAAQTSTSARRTINATNALGQGLATTTLAAPLQDWSRDGGENLANVGDDLTFDLTDFQGVPFIRTVKEGETGMRIPGRVAEGDNYFVRLAKGALVDNFTAGALTLGPRAVPGLKRMYDGDLPGGLEDLAGADIEPYMLPADQAKQYEQSLLRSDPVQQESLARAEGQLQRQQAGMPAPVDPSVDPFVEGGAIVRYDSAIGRAVADQHMIKTVEGQRARLEEMGLIRLGEDNQWEMTPLGMPESQGSLDLEGATPDAPTPQPEPMAAPVGAVDAMEMDTALAQLDELSDDELFRLAEEANAPLKAIQRQRRLDEAGSRVQEIEQQLATLEARIANGELTELGGKRKVNALKKQLDAAQAEVSAADGAMQREALTEGLDQKLGDQLSATLDTQQEFNFDGPDADYVLKPMDDMELVENADGTATWRLKGRGEEVKEGWQRADGNPYGASTPDEYREYLMGYPRDLLRQMGNPTNTPEIAALVKAKTGKRIYSAKKADIVDAFVEVSQRQNKWIFRKGQKGAEQVQQTGLDLAMQGDLDLGLGAKPVEPDPSQARERAKQMILGKMVENGEVQAPFSALPQRPQAEFDQLTLIDDLMSNQQLALGFAEDVTNFYNAAGQNPMDVLEEMRLRVGYNQLDGKADNLSKRMWAAQQKFYELTNEQQKQLLVNSGRYDALIAPFETLDEWSSKLPTAQVDRSKQARPPVAQGDEAGTTLKKPVKPKKQVKGRTDQTVPWWMQKQEPETELVSNGRNFVEQPVEAPAKKKTSPLDQARKESKAKTDREIATEEAALDKQLAALDAEEAQLSIDSQGAFC